MKRSELKYPNVRCEHHSGPDEPGYVVCQHVVDGAAVSHFLGATDKCLGEVLCGPCLAALRSDNTRDDLPLILSCAHGVRDSGWDHVSQASVQ
jgi:hypothetical protein